MTILPTIVPDATLQLIERFDWLKSWRIGQQMRVTALSSSDAGRATLLFGNRQLTARTDQPIRKGEQLTVSVKQLQPEPMLQIVARHPSAPPPQEGLLQAALRSLMPRQAALAPTLAALDGYLATTSMTPELRKQVEALLRKLPTPDELRNPATLRRLIRDSGLFLESRVVTGGESMTGLFEDDLKALLMRLRARLDAAGPQAGSATAGREERTPLPAPPLQRAGTAPPSQARFPLEHALQLLAGDGGDRLWRMVDGAISRLVLHQSLTVESQLHGEPRWLLELPVRSGDGIDTIPIQIQGPPPGSTGEEGSGWSFNLSIDLPNLGPLQIHAGLTGRRLHATLWSTRPETVTLIEAHLEPLRERLAEHVDEIELACRHGAPATTGQTPRLPTLVDEWA